MSAPRLILSDERIRLGLRGIFLIEVLARLALGLFYGVMYPPAASPTFWFLLPPLVLFLMTNRLPLIVPVLAFGVEAGSFLQMQIMDFGWETGFQLYIICLSLACFLYEFLSLRLRIFFALAPLLGFGLNAAFMPVMEPVFQLSRVEQFAFFSANLIICTLINLGLIFFLVFILVRREQELEALASSRAQLIADLSHEIKTPVAAMLTRVQVAMDESLPEAMRDLLAMLERNLRGQTRLVNRMLDYSSAGMPFAADDYQTVDLKAFVGECVEAHLPIAEEKGLRWRITGQVEKKTAPALLSHVLNNLIANAVAFSPPGGEVAIELANEPDGGTRISVADQGPGIDPALLPKLFDPFVRGDPQRGRKENRHGLGLSIAQRAAKQLGGEISVESSLGKGSRFVLSL